MLFSLFSVCILASSAAGVSLPVFLNPRAADAPYSVLENDLSAALKCPNGADNSKGIILLVHGTASTGDETWRDSPYNVFLPKDGYAICWLNLPSRSLGDAQVTAEYFAYNTQQLAPKSATKKVVTIAHSQGAGLTIQWALLYWPSTRGLVSRFVALAGDFHGTSEAPYFCTLQQLIQGGCQQSLIQQSVGSHYLTAQNKRGNTALVPTTSIYTRFDEIIQDENINPTSILPSADNYALQDSSVCGPLHLADHFTMVVDPAAYGIAKLAISAGSGPTPINQFNKLYCSYFIEDQLLNLTALPHLIKSGAVASINVVVGNSMAKKEPALKQYVCDAGDAPQSQCSGA